MGQSLDFEGSDPSIQDAFEKMRVDFFELFEKLQAVEVTIFFDWDAVENRWTYLVEGETE